MLGRTQGWRITLGSDPFGKKLAKRSLTTQAGAVAVISTSGKKQKRRNGSSR